MHIYSVLQKGSYHQQHCEDYLVITETGHPQLLCAIMDGCTMGTDSYFASTLTGKILRKIALAESYKTFYGQAAPSSPEAMLKHVLAQLFAELKIIKQQLLLDTKELLTTLMLMIADTKSQQGIILVIGDGVVCINGEVTIFEQDNKPDYLGFHLGEDFESWYGQQTQKLVFHTMNDVSMASDGIELFEKLRAEVAMDPLSYLLIDKHGAEHAEMLQLKLKRLEHEDGQVPGDDLAVVRLIS